MDREVMPTYYPGDTVRLNLEIRHRPNFRTITARLVVSPEREEGAVVELLEVTGETLSGQCVIFDLADVQTPRFRYAQEPRESSPVVKHASTERV